METYCRFLVVERDLQRETTRPIASFHMASDALMHANSRRATSWSETQVLDLEQLHLGDLRQLPGAKVERDYLTA